MFVFNPSCSLVACSLVAASENPWVRGHDARIFQEDAGETPAYPAKNEVFGGCLVLIRGS